MFRTVFFAISCCTLLGCSGLSAKDASLPAPATHSQQGREALAPLPYYNTPDFSPHFLRRPDSVRAQITHRIGPFHFSNQDGTIISNTNLQGKVHVANFMFTSCGSICPAMTNELKRVAVAFRNEPGVVLLSYSVTPWIDTPERLRRYRSSHGLDSFARWHFLTGRKDAIYSLARRSYFAEEEIGFTRDSSEFLHTEHIVLVDGDGRIRGIYNGTLALETQQLIEDIEGLLQQKKSAAQSQEQAAKRI